MTQPVNEDFVVFAKLSELKPEALLSRILFNQITNQEKNMAFIDDVKNMLGDLSNQLTQIHGKNQAAMKALSDENISLNRRNSILEETIRTNETDMQTASALVRKVSEDLKADDSAPTDQVMETYSLTETTTVEQPADQPADQTAPTDTTAPADQAQPTTPAEDTNTTTNPVPQPEQPTVENPVPQPEQPTVENPVPQPTEVVTEPTDQAAPAEPVVMPIPDPAPDQTDAAPAPAPADVADSTPAPAENVTPVYNPDATPVVDQPAVNSPAVQYTPPIEEATAPAVDTNVVNTGTPSVQNLENAPTPSVDVPNVPNV